MFLALGAVILGAVLRLLAAAGDLWLDEIWTWSFTVKLHSAFEIFTRVRHDNNHFLNTCFVYFLGPDSSPFLYRLPAVVAGVASIAVSGWCMLPRGKTVALLTTLLTAASYLMIHYSSEARGYAYLLLFALLSFGFLERMQQREHWWDAIGFALSAILAITSHLTFLYCFSAFLAWSVYELAQKRERYAKRLPLFLVAYLPPVLFFVWVYVVNLRGQMVGGGPYLGLVQPVVSLLSLIAGGPETGPLAAMGALVVTLIALAGIWRAGRENSGLFVFYACLILCPLVHLLLRPPLFVYLRYFLVCVPFLLFAVAQALAGLLISYRSLRCLGASLLGIVLLGNGVHTTDLIRLGRGNYTEAIQFMRSHTLGNTVTVASDHDFRNAAVLWYCERRLPRLKALVYFQNRSWPPQGPEWLLLHSWQRPFEPQRELGDRNGNRYRFVRLFPYAGLSGWHWAVYHNTRADTAHQEMSQRVPSPKRTPITAPVSSP